MSHNVQGTKTESSKEISGDVSPAERVMSRDMMALYIQKTCFLSPHGQGRDTMP